jgi:hypothetical protein
MISASTMPPSPRSTVMDSLVQVAWSGSDVSVYQRFKKWDRLWTLMKANGQFFGSVQILSNIQSHMVYFQLSQIYSLAAKRLGVLGRNPRYDGERFDGDLTYSGQF